MPSSRQPLKYLIYYPFSVLSVAKAYILIISSLTVFVWQWKHHPDNIGIVLFVIPIFNLLGCAAASISLWFMVQKFYWKKVEMAFNLTGLTLTFLCTIVLLVAHIGDDSIRNYVLVNHVFETITWSFCLFWCSVFTSNNVSDLFINEWGMATEDIEIEALEGHF
ncbi:hypothetical protein RB195_012732 [Necator americanus]|uniref:Uncharacterized protein n=1 Tax=Necator americanus TaxID=51031 RepID=A0ABR1DSI5_NECAM